jgi:hypothetical protein
MKQIFTLIAVGVFITLTSIQEANAQRWNRYKKEFGISLGATNMLGDLGGGANDGSRFGDFQIGNTSYAFGGFFKYRFHDRFAVKLNLIYGQIYSDDQTTDNAGRQYRNLDVKTNLLELSGQLEFYIMREKIGSRYKIKGVKGYGSSSFAMYLFAGIGGTYFNPKGTDANGNWVNLAPLNTEGQGLEGAPKDYSQITMVFPTGIGFKYNITRSIGLQFEAGMRFTTTDYLDDASTQYYNGDKLAAAYGELSKQLADKRYDDKNRHAAGGTRGHDDKKDTYMFGLLTLTYRMKSRARSRIRL